MSARVWRNKEVGRCFREKIKLSNKESDGTGAERMGRIFRELGVRAILDCIKENEIAMLP